MAKLVISSVQFSVYDETTSGWGDWVTKAQLGSNSKYKVRLTIKNDDSYGFRAWSLKISWLDSSGKQIGYKWLAGSSSSKNGAEKLGSTVASGESITKTLDGPFKTSDQGLSANETAENCVLYAYGWVTYDDSTEGSARKSGSYTASGIGYVGEFHKLSIKSFKCYRSTNEGTDIAFKASFTRNDPQSYWKYTNADSYSITNSSGTVLYSGSFTSDTDTTITLNEVLSDGQATTETETYTARLYNSTLGETVSKSITIGTPNVHLHLRKSSSGGVGIGRYCSTDGNLEIQYPTYFYGEVHGTGITYKNSAVKTDDVWIDGKPIYRYTCSKESIAGASTDTTTVLVSSIVSTLGIDKIIKMEGSAIQSDGSMANIPSYCQSNNYKTLAIDSGNLSFMHNEGKTTVTNDVYATIWFTIK